MVKEPNRKYFSDMPFRMSEEEKAKSFLQNTNMSRSEIARKTGISKRQLSTYSTNQSALDNAKHTAVMRLAQLYEADYAENVGGNQLDHDSSFRKEFVDAEMGFVSQLSTLRIPFSDDSIFARKKDNQKTLEFTDYFLASSSKLLEDTLKDIVLQDVTRKLSTDVSLAYLYMKAINHGWSPRDYTSIYKDMKFKEFEPVLEGYNLLRVERSEYEEKAKSIASQAKGSIINYKNFLGESLADNDQHLAYKVIKNYCDQYARLIEYPLSSKVSVQIDPLVNREFWFDSNGNPLDLTLDERMDSFAIRISLNGDAVTQLIKHDRLPDKYWYVIIPIYSDYADIVVNMFVKQIGRLCGFNL